MTAWRYLGLVLSAAVLALASARLCLALAEICRSYEGARGLSDALSGPTAMWHAFAIEGPLRALGPLVATTLALRFLETPRARDGALFGTTAAMCAFAVQQRMHPVGHEWFLAIIVVLFGLSVGVCAASLHATPKSSGPIFLVWLAHLVGAASLLLWPTARVRAAVLLLAVAAALGTGAHALFQRERRHFRDEFGATISLASRTIQSLTPWHLRRAQGPSFSIRWLTFGFLTTLGLVVFSCSLAVAAGRGLGLDFATFDHDGGAASADLAFVGAFILAAFSLAGWILGRVALARDTSESIGGPLVLIPLVVVALPTGRSDFFLTIVFALAAALFTAAGAVMARRATP